jgi:broad specificity phosphatase PhoE
MLSCRPFIFLRHGETDWVRENRVQGQSDTLLNAKGIEQARHARGRLRSSQINTICCSPLLRARMTAEIINEAFDLPIVIIEELKECYLGSLEGQVSKSLAPHWLKDRPVPDGESYDGFIARALVGINRALEHDGPVLIVSHGGVYWTVQAHADLDKTSNVPTCSPILHEPPSYQRGRWTVTDLT